MVIRDKENFTPMIARLLESLGYENVQIHNGEGIDISAVKDGEKYCFVCRYDIEAIGEKRIDNLIELAKSGGYDKKVYVTNSSFISSAKKKGEKENVLLWDRNTVDRLAIGAVDSPFEEEVVVKKSHIGLIIGILIGLVCVAAAGAAYMFFIR